MKPLFLFMITLMILLDGLLVAPVFAIDQNVSITATVPSPPAPTPSPSGGGGGGGGSVPTVVTSVVFSGRAYPLSNVIILKDGQLAVRTIAGPDAQFRVEITGLTAGNYSFAVYGEDRNARRSTLFAFPVMITQGAVTTISGILLSPTIDIDKTSVARGDSISIFGTSIPSGDVTIAVNSNTEQFVKTQADKDGVYLYDFDTSVLESGSHFTKSKVATANQISSFSSAVSFQVGSSTVTKGSSTFKNSDLNNDGRINLVDFSIIASWYKKQLSPAFAAIEVAQLNGDGKVTLVDFSILAFYWTG